METMFLPKTLADMAFMKMGGTIGNSSILDRADFQRCFGDVYNPCASADTPEHIPHLHSITQTLPVVCCRLTRPN